jgi:hypothetical protein
MDITCNNFEPQEVIVGNLLIGLLSVVFFYIAKPVLILLMMLCAVGFHNILVPG